MKLLVIFPSPIRGGAEEYALTIAKSGIKEGWQVEAAFPKTPETESLIKDFKEQEIIYHSLNIVPVEGKYFKLFREYIPQFLRMIILLIKVKPDIIQLNIPWPYWGFASLFVCAFFNIPTLVVFHLFPHQFFYSKIKLKAYQWANSRRQSWIAVSEDNRNFIYQSFEVPKEKITVIYNGTKIDSNFINYTEQETQQLHDTVCQELGLPINSKLLLTVGRLHSQKGYRDLVQIISPIIEKFPNTKFIWIGEGQLRNYLVEQINKYQIEDSVFLLGYRSDVPRFLKAADFFIFPTYLEGLPFAIIEALAHQIPIVASNASSLPEIIENKVHGLLFEKEDKQALLEAIIWALEHPEKMQEMAKNAQKRVQDFSEEKMLEQTLALIKEITDNV